ncbi:hypothetical protein BU15DRAFT_56112 [Melanogaster broomeanus]|nr:hypothetical protein BU15DRAFT_56112 [Melanogaster broomeanus]
MALCLSKRFVFPAPQPVCIATRWHSTSPYGRSHIQKKHPRSLPAPVVPHFIQHVTRADGSTFTHWTTSPRSKIVLTRDTTNHPLWNATERVSGASSGNNQDEEEEGTGRMGRWKKRFGDEVSSEEWLEFQEGVEGEKEPAADQGETDPGTKADKKEVRRRVHFVGGFRLNHV